MSYLKFADLKAGDRVTILKYPYSWSNCAGGIYGMNKVKYPYTLTIKNIEYIHKEGYTPHFAIQDTNGYGWSICKYSEDIFQINNTLNNRLSKINNLNI